MSDMSDMTPTKYPVEPRAPAILTVDVGGSHVKELLNGIDERRRFASGHKLTPQQMVDGVVEQTKDWDYVGISVGVPGPVVDGRLVKEPVNLGNGWVGFDFEAAFGKPTKVINDAAMQALGAYEGGRMLFLGLGTGLGTTMIIDGVIAPMELGHLPFRKGTFEDYVGEAAQERDGPQALEEGRPRDDRATLRGGTPGLHRARRRQRALPRGAAGALPTGPQRGRVPGRLPTLDRVTRRLVRTPAVFADKS